jgi:tight adherence protein C
MGVQGATWAYGIFALGVAAAAAGAWAEAEAPVRDLRRRLEAVARPRQGTPEGPEPFRRRVVDPLLAAWARRLGRMTPASLREGMARTLEKAGRSPTRADMALLGRGLAAAAGLAAGLTLALALGLPARLGVIVALLGLLVGPLLPTVALTQAVTARQRAVARALPDTLDLLVTCVEAGLGFEAALTRVAEGRSDPLSDEIRLALVRMRYGQGRADALREMGRRTGVEDVARFAAAVAQADELGTSIGGVLRAQSQLLRRLRLMRSEEAAAKVPVKMLFPMVMFILPGLFLLVLGPAVLRALRLGLFR